MQCLQDLILTLFLLLYTCPLVNSVQNVIIKTIPIQILKRQKLRSGFSLIANEQSLLHFVFNLCFYTCVLMRFLKTHCCINWYVSWIHFKSNAHKLYVIIVHLNIMAVNILIISNSLNFYYKISRVKQQGQHCSRLSGINWGLIMK